MYVYIKWFWTDSAESKRFFRRKEGEMKLKVRFIIIGIPVIFVIALVLAFTLKLLMVERDAFGQIDIYYFAGKDENGDIGLNWLDIRPKHSLAKFSEYQTEMGWEQAFELLGKPTKSIGSGIIKYLYKIDKNWTIKLCILDDELEIVDYANNRVFKLEDDEYSTAASYLRATGTFTGSRDNRPKHSLAKFSKVKIGMSPAKVVKLAGKPTVSVDSSFIWYRYKIDTGWYMDLHFFNEQLSDMSIVEFPNNRVFELEQEDYITTLPCPSTVAQIDGSSASGTFTDDRDGRAYRTVKVGELTWMAENLDFVTDSSVCYKNADSNCTKYGRLYNWDDATKACPAGWRLPGDEDWALAVANKCNGRIHWKMAAKKLKTSTGWQDNWGGSTLNGTDEIGFSALPGASRSNDNFFLGIGSYGDWWSATESDVTLAGCREISLNLRRDSRDKERMLSVRCVRE